MEAALELVIPRAFRSSNRVEKIGKHLLSRLMPEKRPYEIRDTDLKGFLVRVQPSGHISYYCEFKFGRRKRILLGAASVITPVQAREEAKAILADVVRGIDPLAKQRAAKCETLGQYLDNEYSDWVAVNHRRGDLTIKRIKSSFPDLLNRRMTDINTWIVEKWQTQKIKSGVTAGTVNRDVIALRGALSKALEWGLLSKHPLAGLKTRREDRQQKVRFLSQAELARLKDALITREERFRQGRESANEWRRERGYAEMRSFGSAAFVDHLRPMVILSLNTGLRRGELFNLRWKDVDLNQRVLTVVGETAKSGRTRHVPLNEEAFLALNGWRASKEMNEDALVFPNSSGGRMDNIQTSWEGVCRAAGIQNFRWHDLRHHFASSLAMAGVDLNTIRELLGHSDIKMTLRYAHLSPATTARAVRMLDQRISTSVDRESSQD